MQTENGVEWDLVDYGAGVFHVVSYQAEPAEKPARLEVVRPAEGRFGHTSDPMPDCLLRRCWTAMTGGCRAA